MNVPTRLAAFAVMLAVIMGAAALAGAAIGPIKDKVGVSHAGQPAMAGDAHGGRGAMGAMAHAGAGANGLAVSSDGLTLAVDRTVLAVGRPARLQFRIIDARGHSLQSQFELESARRMHFIVVSRDTATYQHLHPTEAADGTWSIEVILPEAGVYRAYADFQTAGTKHVLASDLFAPGNFAPRPLPAPSDTARPRLVTTGQSSGEQVRLDASGLRAGRPATLTFAVTRNGRPVTGFEPYLGAMGHLVALRSGDLAYLHVHPDSAGTAANAIQFITSFPTAGTYRLFLQFQRDAKVRTVVFTLQVPR